MKKIILMTACTAAVLLSGCSDNELASAGDGIGTSTQSAIGFHVVGNQAETRATIINSGNIDQTDFRVFAFTQKSAEDTSDDIQFMGDKANDNGHTGIVINHTKGNWDYANAEDLHYWPESTKLNFYAISPASFANEMMMNFGWNIAKDSKTITYTSIDEYGNTTNPSNLDLMYAVTKNQEKSTNAGKVNLKFKHILSQIVFQAKTKYDDMQVEIKDVFIHNVCRKGTFTFPSSTEPSQLDWKTTDLLYGAKTYIIKDQNIVVGDKNTAKDISSSNPSLFVPQALTAWNPAEKNKAEADAAKLSYLEINCRIKQNDVYVFGKDGYTTLYVPFSASWQPGKRYVYTLIFGGGYDEHSNPILEPINFEAEAADWANPDATATENGDVNL